jgi:hypothetical protein
MTRLSSAQGDWLETTQDLEEARARLERRSPQVLAAFIVSLAQESGPVGEQVRTFIVGDDARAVAQSLCRRIAGIEVADRRASRDRGGATVGERLGYILEAIETLVLPADSRRAFELLVALIERDGDALECCGEHCDAVESAMERAADLTERAVRGLPQEEVLPALRQLVASDDYGTRRPLAAVVRRIGAAGREG